MFFSFILARFSSIHQFHQVKSCTVDYIEVL